MDKPNDSWQNGNAIVKKNKTVQTIDTANAMQIERIWNKLKRKTFIFKVYLILTDNSSENTFFGNICNDIIYGIGTTPEKPKNIIDETHIGGIHSNSGEPFKNAVWMLNKK